MDEESRAPRKKKKTTLAAVNGVETGVQVSLEEPDQTKELEIIYDKARELGLAVLRSEAPGPRAAEAGPNTEKKKAEPEKRTLGHRVVSLNDLGKLTIARKMNNDRDGPADQ